MEHKDLNISLPCSSQYKVRTKWNYLYYILTRVEVWMGSMKHNREKGDGHLSQYVSCRGVTAHRSHDTMPSLLRWKKNNILLHKNLFSFPLIWADSGASLGDGDLPLAGRSLRILPPGKFGVEFSWQKWGTFKHLCTSLHKHWTTTTPRGKRSQQAVNLKSISYTME